MNQAIQAVAEVLKKHRTFVLTTHVNPDGDGLGSEVALAEWLAGQGKLVHILNHSATPDFYFFLDPGNRIKQFNEATDARTFAEADVIVVLDTNHTDRVRSMQAHLLSSKAIKVCIDHHLDPEEFADHYLIDDDATSTGELVYRLLVHLNGSSLSPLISQALYCAIMTDTGSFRFPRVDAEIHRIVAHLIECGADPVRIYHEVYEQWTAGRVQLLGDALASLRTEYDGRLAHITITQNDLKHTGTTEVDTDNFTIYPMQVAGVVAGILFLELKDGIKMSFRSKGDIPINELAKEFGGNGHKNAAGARLYGCTLADTKEEVLSAASKYINNGGIPA
ncbi:MAG: bifunctional oligoribonuclease/PAP phosphatase NrnA [Bacteroidetes bacterium]|nr:bifunctional oligoribonuclease/PAP phosphatase NrnA [Bacteroidota bacterium]MCW5897494.1 bifunctional oligoribonuclease/PAP phosphatase NrnA [Bacteroidota bacterium]